MSRSAAIGTAGTPPRGAAAGRTAARRGRGGEESGAAGGWDASKRPSILPVLFLLTIVCPLILQAGGLRLTPYRLILLAMFLPLFFRWVSGKAGAILVMDLLVLAYAGWATLAMLVNHGIESIEGSGMFAMESLGAYLLGRVMIRGPNDFRAFAKALAVVIGVMLVLGAIEATQNGWQPLNTIFRLFGRVHGHNFIPPRWGLNRAQGPFEHAILFGVFLSSGVGVLHYALTKGKRSALGIALPCAAVFFSLSLGAYIAAALQVALILYDAYSEEFGFKAGPERWWLLMWGFVALYFALDMASNRTPVMIFIQTFAFSELSAAVRIHTWNHGMANAMGSPIFGIGHHNWSRPFWLTSSVDNFWLLNIMRYGFVGGALVIAVFLTTFFKAGRLVISDPDVAMMRKGWLITLAGICLAICTVHLWSATFAYLMFLLGAGMWVFDDPSAVDPKAAARDGEDAPADAGGRRGPPRRAAAPALVRLAELDAQTVKLLLRPPPRLGLVGQPA
ncbi:MAG: hypothetical protein AAGI51_16860, partial [Pseudomonadota bacterium]